MKRLIYILLLISANINAQTWDIVNGKYFKRSPFIWSSDSLRSKFYHVDTVLNLPSAVTHKDMICNKKDTLYISNGASWDTIGPKKNSSGGNVAFNGSRVVTRIGLPNINAGGTTLPQFIENYFFPSTSPTATLTGGLNLEWQAAGGNLTTILSYTATRPASCLAISTISINGGGKTLDSPFLTGHTQSSTDTAYYSRNTTTTFTITVTSSDSKTGTASQSFNFYYPKYWGKINSNSAPSDASIKALTGAGVGSGYDLDQTQTRVKDYSGIDGAGDYIIFAFPSSFGTPTFKVYGLTNTGFTRVRNNAFVNASGGSVTYQVWISNDRMYSPITDIKIQ